MRQLSVLLFLCGIANCNAAHAQQKTESGDTVVVPIDPIPLPPIATVQADAGAPHGGSTAVQIAGEINNDDYPESAVRNRQSGITLVRFTINADGTTSACEIAESSGSDALDAQTCNIIINRFRYKPARDRRGKPIVETRSQRVRWSLPEGTSLIDLSKLNMALEFDVLPTGVAINCKIVGRPTRASDLRVTPCGNAAPTFTPLLDEHGQPVTGHVKMEMRVTVTYSETKRVGTIAIPQ